MRLTVNDLREVRTLLFPVRWKWYHIGIELGLKVGELATIRANNADIEDCLTAMLTLYLKSTDPVPKWKALGDALRSGPINEAEIARAGTLLYCCFASLTTGSAIQGSHIAMGTWKVKGIHTPSLA